MARSGLQVLPTRTRTDFFGNAPGSRLSQWASFGVRTGQFSRTLPMDFSVVAGRRGTQVDRFSPHLLSQLQFEDSELTESTRHFRGNSLTAPVCLRQAGDSSRRRRRRGISVRTQALARKWPDAKPITNGHVTRRALPLIRQLKLEPPSTEEELEEQLERWVRATNPRRRDLLDVLKELDREETRLLLCKVMEWAFRSGQDWFQPNIRDYTKLLERLGRQRRLEDMAQVFEDMDASGFPPDLVSYSVLVDAYGRAGQVEKAEGVVEEMRSVGIQPDVKTMTSLMAAYGAAGKPEKAEAVLEEMEAAGCLPTPVTYAVLINAYARQSRTDDSQRMFDRMQLVSRLMPDRRTFTSLMDAYGKAGRVEQAVAVLKAMRQAGITPDDTSMALLVEAYERIGGRTREAVQLILEMETGGQKPGPATYTALIGLFGREGMVSEAAEVFEEMRQVGLEPNARTFTRLYCTYARAGMLEACRNVSEQMEATGWGPNDHNLRLMVKKLEEGGLKEEAARMERMRVEKEAQDGSVGSGVVVRVGVEEVEED